MNLPFDLHFEVGRKKAWLFLKDYFDKPLQVLNGQLINLATKWGLLEQFKIDDETLPALAHSGFFDAVKWLYSRGLYIKPFSKNVMYEIDWSDYLIDMAAAGGHLDIMEWLYLQGEGFTTFAMDYAALSGYLNVVKWLHQRGGACTSLAFDCAAGNSDLEMLEWLHQNRSEGFSKNIFKNNDELPPRIYKFILERYPTLFHPSLIVNAARYGDLDTLKQLYAKNFGDWRYYSGVHPNGIRFWYTTLAYIEAGKKGYLPVVTWFIETKLLV